MADRVKPLKVESPASGGTQLDLLSTSLNPNEDHVDVRGVFIQSDISDDEVAHITRDSSNRLTFKDNDNPTPKTLTDLVSGTGGLTEATHEVLDSLTHDLAEDNYLKVTRTGGQISNITVWETSGMTKKIREGVLTRVSGQVSQIDYIQYDSAGSEKYRITSVVTRVDGQIDNIEDTRTDV